MWGVVVRTCSILLSIFLCNFRLKKKLDGNYTRMLRVILNKSWRQHPTRHQLYGHLPPITKTIQVRRTRHAGYCWRSKDELISDVLLWTPTYGQAKAGRPARTYIQQLCEDTGCNPEDLPKAMNDREKWRERVRDIRAGGTTWWWWWWLIILLDRLFPPFMLILVVVHRVRPYFFSRAQHVLLVLESLRDGRWVAVQLLFSRVLFPGFVQSSTQNSCVVIIWLFLPVFRQILIGATI